MGFWTPPTDENRAILKAEAENLSNDGAIWVTSLWKPSDLGYIGKDKGPARNWFPCAEASTRPLGATFATCLKSESPALLGGALLYLGAAQGRP